MIAPKANFTQLRVEEEEKTGEPVLRDVGQGEHQGLSGSNIKTLWLSFSNSQICDASINYPGLRGCSFLLASTHPTNIKSS